MVGSNTVVDLQGKKVRGRVYPWGVVEGMFLCSAPVTTDLLLPVN